MPGADWPQQTGAVDAPSAVAGSQAVTGLADPAAPVTVSDPDITAAAERLRDVVGASLAEQADLLDTVHARLQAALGSLDDV